MQDWKWDFAARGWFALAWIIVLASEARGATLNVASATTEAGEQALGIPVFLETDAAEDVAALQVDIVYDPDVFTLTSAALGAAARDAGKELNLTLVSAGRARILIAGFNTDPIENGIVALPIFSVASQAEKGIYIIGLEEAVLADPINTDEPVSATMTDGVIQVGELPFHSADTDRNRRFTLDELVRVVQLYNVAGHQCDENTEDGYAPGAGSCDCAPHSSDFMGEPDWTIGLSELLRMIQLHEAPAYRNADGTEDGFFPVFEPLPKLERQP